MFRRRRSTFDVYKIIFALAISAGPTVILIRSGTIEGHTFGKVVVKIHYQKIIYSICSRGGFQSRQVVEPIETVALFLKRPYHIIRVISRHRIRFQPTIT